MAFQAMGTKRPIRRRGPKALAAVALVVALVAGAAAADSSGGYPDFVKGADLSMLQALQDGGVQYRDAGQAKDPLAIFKAHGCNYVRLRIFVNPDGMHGQVNTLAYTLALAKRVKAMGLPLLLDFHYSDGWADPGKQYVPAGWKDFTHEQLTERTYTYTRETLAAFQSAGCLPDMVQVGNEVINGMMWPDGGPLKDGASWGRFADLMKAGIRAVREFNSVTVMVHVAKGSSEDRCKWFFDNCKKQGVDFDVIGLSYYPFTDGSMEELKANLGFLSTTYGKDIYVAETGFYEEGGSAGSTPYPTTPEGQRAFFEAVMRMVAATPGGHGKGVFYWAPEWIIGGGWKGSKTASNRALFDEGGNVLPAMDVYGFLPSEMW